MAVTALSNVIVPSIFAPYMLEQSLVKNALVNSGVIAHSPVLDEKLAGGGLSFNMPSWRPLDASTTAANVPTDASADVATPEAILARANIAVRLDRNKAWGAADMVQAAAGSDPMAAIAGYVGGEINKWRQKSLLSVIAGCINETNVSGNVNTIGVEAVASYTAGTKVSAGAIVDTMSAYGDSATSTAGSAILMHSDTFRYLMKNDFTSFQRQSEQTYGLPTYLGMLVLVDDTLPKVAGSTDGFVYTTYVVKPGAIAFGVGAAREPVEVQRQALQANGGGVEYLVARDAFAYHINGFKWVGTPAGLVPTDAELATANKWAAVYSGKAIGVAALVHNVA